mmetsp:Transcript_44755/g.140339  ORF Transcript_44755/g.140339 Transcript_44755/m.140339 type:complete len:261 (-) Transcript_44755:3223-4005(-)
MSRIPIPIITSKPSVVVKLGLDLLQAPLLVALAVEDVVGAALDGAAVRHKVLLQHAVGDVAARLRRAVLGEAVLCGVLHRRRRRARLEQDVVGADVDDAGARTDAHVFGGAQIRGGLGDEVVGRVAAPPRAALLLLLLLLLVLELALAHAVLDGLARVLQRARAVVRLHEHVLDGEAEARDLSLLALRVDVGAPQEHLALVRIERLAQELRHALGAVVARRGLVRLLLRRALVEALEVAVHAMLEVHVHLVRREHVDRRR